MTEEEYKAFNAPRGDEYSAELADFADDINTAIMYEIDDDETDAMFEWGIALDKTSEKEYEFFEQMTVDELKELITLGLSIMKKYNIKFEKSCNDSSHTEKN